MTATVEVARWMREVAKEALAATRVDAIDAPDGVRLERRGDAFAASIELDDAYDAATAALAHLYGAPLRAGTDPAGVRWLAYQPAQSFGLLLLVERDGAAVLHLEPFARQWFKGIDGEVDAWFAARGAATSRPQAEVAKAQAARRAARKAASGPRDGGRLTAARVKKVARWFASLGEAALDRAAIDAFAAVHDLVLDDDHDVAGRRYLSAELGTSVFVHVRFALVTVILAESDGGSGAEDALAAAAHDRRHAALREDVVAALGDPTADGRHTYISTERWAVWRTGAAVIALVTGADPRGDGGYASALRIVDWPRGRALPDFDDGVTDWINARCKDA